MKITSKYILSTLLVGFTLVSVFAKRINSDSLWAVYNNSLQCDTSRLEAFNVIVQSYIENNPDTSIVLANELIEFAEKHSQKKYVAKALITIGQTYNQKSDFANALKYFLMSLQINEQIHNRYGIGTCYLNIGIVYYYQSDFHKDLQYQLMALNIFEKIGDKNKLGVCYSHIAGDYVGWGDYKTAITYFLKTLSFAIELNDKSLMTNVYANLGDAYNHIADYKKSLEYQLNSLKLSKVLDDKYSIAMCYINLSELYISLGDYKRSILYNDSALAIHRLLGSTSMIGIIYNDISTAYSKMGDYKSAFSNYVKFKNVTDSIFNSDNNKKLGDLKLKYEMDKKDMEIKTQSEISMEKNVRQQKVIYSVVVILVLIFCFSIFIFRSYRISQSQKRIIQDKQKEVLDSIHYAKRIQDALLKEQNHVSTHLPEHFVLFKPKDIVSGDFYWSFEKEGYWYVAVADCTGHGVPGAFLTMLGTSFLNEIVSTERLLSPASILDQLRAKFIKELGQTGVAGENKDGMDISLVRIDLRTKLVMWAGANNSLYFIRNGNIFETKANKQPIGYADILTPFTNHEFSTTMNDQLVIFSDGYADQFGGPNKKKFMSKRFKELFVTNTCADMISEKQKLNNAFEDWKGDSSQIDDVCVIGIKL